MRYCKISIFLFSFNNSSNQLKEYAKRYKNL